MNYIKLTHNQLGRLEVKTRLFLVPRLPSMFETPERLRSVEYTAILDVNFVEAIKLAPKDVSLNLLRLYKESDILC